MAGENNQGNNPGNGSGSPGSGDLEEFTANGGVGNNTGGQPATPQERLAKQNEIPQRPSRAQPDAAPGSKPEDESYRDIARRAAKTMSDAQEERANGKDGDNSEPDKQVSDQPPPPRPEDAQPAYTPDDGKFDPQAEPDLADQENNESQQNEGGGDDKPELSDREQAENMLNGKGGNLSSGTTGAERKAKRNGENSGPEYGPPNPNEGGAGKGGRIKRLLKKRKKVVLTGALFSSVAGLGIAGFLSLTGLKIDISLDSIDQVSFANYNNFFDRRSQAWFEAYIKLRLTELDGGTQGETLFFRADRYDDRGSPERLPRMRDWYRTMRASNFEADLLRQHGIAFTSMVGPNNEIRPGIIQIKGDQIEIDAEDLLRERNALPGGILGGKWDDVDLTPLNNILDDDLAEIINFSKFSEDDKKARSTLKNSIDALLVDENFRTRRYVRKTIQNRIGIREWRVFDGTRSSFENQVNKWQLKILSNILSSYDSGKFIACLFNAGPCARSSDPASKDTNPAKQEFDGKTAGDQSDDANRSDDPDNPPDVDSIDGDDSLDKSQREVAEELNTIRNKLTTVNPDDGFVARTIKKTIANKILSKVNVASGIIDALDTIVHLHKLVKNNVIYKMVTNQKVGYAIALATTYQIGQDMWSAGQNPNIASGDLWTGTAYAQDENGEDPGAGLPIVDRTEYEAMIASLDGFEDSEAYETLIRGSSALVATRPGGVYADALSNEVKDIACANPAADSSIPLEDGGRFHVNCAEDKLGTGSGPTKENEGYVKSPVGKIGNAIEAGWSKFGFLSAIAQGFNSLMNAIIEPIVGPLIDGFLSIFGYSREELAQALTEKILGWLGAVPTIVGSEPGGKIFNEIVDGKIATSQGALRNAGAPLSNEQTRDDSNRDILLYLEEEKQNMSLVERYASINNPNSLTSNLVLLSPDRDDLTRPVQAVASIFGSAKNSVLNMFGLAAFAQTGTKINPTDEQVLRNYSGLDSFYAFPRETTEADPLTMPLDGLAGCTNARTITLNGQGNGPALLSGFALDWDLVQDADLFWPAVEEALLGADGVNEANFDGVFGRIHNICLADEQIMSSMTCQYTGVDECGLGSSSAQARVSSNVTADNLIVAPDTSEIPCAPGTGEGVVDTEAYRDGEKFTIRVCTVDGVLVNSQISGQVKAMFDAAAAEEAPLDISTGTTGFRTMASAQDLYQKYRNGTGALAAVPGTSNHQFGVALDISCNGLGFINLSKPSRKSQPCWDWLNENAAKYGFKNLPSENWHWSVSGT